MKLEPINDETDEGEFNDLFYNDKKPSFWNRLFRCCYP
jgi:hypothetical protein